MEILAESPRRSGDSTSSTEFEFWKMVGSPTNSNSNSFPPSPLLTADELFIDGVLIPLHLLSLPSNCHNFHNHVVSEGSEDFNNLHNQQNKGEDKQEQEEKEVEMASITSCLAPVSVSRRWRDIFRVGEKKTEENIKEREKKSSKERKNSSSGGAAELNINIWPFRRCRSAGDGATAQPKPSVFSRRVSSAPCSRSNSSSSSSRWCAAASPGRAGIHFGRSNPVWQLKKHKEAAGRKSGGGARLRGTNLNVNTCTGSRSRMSCRRDDREGAAGGGSAGGGGRSVTGGGGGGGGSLFSLKMIFS